jgi:ATP-dependent DNA helicase RecG
MNLPGLLHKGEGSRLAMLPQVDTDLIAETMVAFANADGGTLILGVSGEGQPTGQVAPEEVEAALRVAETRCRPPVPTHWESTETPLGLVIAIQVPRSTELHSLHDGRVLVRQGKENRPLGGDAVRQLANSRESGSFEEQEVAGATQDSDWDPEMVQEYLHRREERGAARTTSLRQLLFEIGAISVNGAPTVAGMLLFGRKPQGFLPQCGLMFIKFAGTEMRSQDGQAGYARREEVHGPLARMVERAWNVIWEEMSMGAVVNGLAREEIPAYPRFAVREALVNAICHRDYRLSGRRVEIRLFSDRLEVISPGGLPGYMTIDNIVEEHFSRNPRIVGGLYYWGYIEELGLGIDRMIEEMVSSGHPPPLFEATPYSFKVTLHAKRVAPSAQRWERTVNDRQTQAVTYLRQNGSITNREYQVLCPTVSAETLRLDLNDLVEKGILLRIGAKKGTYYILK